MDKDNDMTQAEQRDVPGGEEAQRSFLTSLAAEAHQVGTTLLDAAALYGAKKAVDKIRKPPPPPPTASGAGDSQGGDG